MIVGFTNGCFDLLHEGHVHLLESAHKHCDYLIVAVNDDASVRALKGPARPVWPLQTRIETLDAIAGYTVDAIIPFNGRVEQLVRAIRPQVLFKGDDYAGKTVAGGIWVTMNGGQVMIIERLAGISTTEIVNAQSRLS